MIGLLRPKIILFNIIFFTVLRDYYHVFRLQKDFCYIALPICNEKFWLGNGEENDRLEEWGEGYSP